MAVLPHEGTFSIMYGSYPVPVGSGYCAGYLARPDRAGRYPVVVLVPDLDGFTAHEKHVARRLARRGLAVLGVDFYGRRPAGREAALSAYHRLDDGHALRLLDEAHEFLASPDVTWTNADRVGVLGLEIGGRFALSAAARRPWVGAAAVVGTPLTGDEDRRHPVAGLLEHLPVPVLGLYGADDQLVAVETVDEAQARNAAGTWLLYTGARHGFLDETGDDFSADAAEDALARLAEFFLARLPAADTADLG